MDAEHLLRIADRALSGQGGRPQRLSVLRGENGRPGAQAPCARVDLRSALSRDEFTLRYQPILDLVSDRIVGFEALLRWRSEKRGLVQPDEFIAIAEESGLIAPIGDWVMREACAAAAARRKWRELPSTYRRCNWESPQFPALDRQARAGVVGPGPRGGSNWEITETARCDESDAARWDGLRTIARDRRAGRARRLRHRVLVAYLRAGRSTRSRSTAFVRGSGDATCRDRGAIIGMATRLRMSVTGEGVEREEQLKRLRLGGRMAQGYLIGRPAEVDEAFALCAVAPQGLRASG